MLSSLIFGPHGATPCRDDNPNQVKNYELYKNKGFSVYAVSVDRDKSDWLEAIKKDGLTYTNVSEKDGGANTADVVYGIVNILLIT